MLLALAACVFLDIRRSDARRFNEIRSFRLAKAARWFFRIRLVDLAAQQPNIFGLALRTGAGGSRGFGFVGSFNRLESGYLESRILWEPGCFGNRRSTCA